MRTIVLAGPIHANNGKPRATITSIPCQKSYRIVVFAGMWDHESQWEMISPHMRDYGSPIIDTRTNNSHRGIESFEQYVDERVKEINEMKEDVVFFAHSQGIRNAVAVAERVGNLRGIIAFDPCPHRGLWWMPPTRRMIRWRYIQAMITGKSFETLPEDEAYFLDGADVRFGPDNGRRLFRVAFSGPFGFPIKSLSELHHPSLVLLSKNNRFMKPTTSLKIAAYHQPAMENVRWIKGGHFAHCNPKFCPYLSMVISQQIKAWEHS